MRLADFVLANLEPILAEWEAFAHSIWPAGKTDPLTLRDHAKDILTATAADMKSAQTATEQSDKSKGEGDVSTHGDHVDGASDVHAVDRVRSGLDLLAVVAEYRALRASVIRLWRESAPSPDDNDLDDLTRFNESIDQSLTEAIRSYTELVDRSRQMFLAILGHDLRNPLHSVSMSAELLSRSENLDEETRSTALRILGGAHAMADMINDLLDFTMTGLGVAMTLAPAAMDLKSLCHQVISELRAVYPTQPVRFTAHDELTGEWDPGRLRQVISNLLGNALQHGGGSAPVGLSLHGEPSAVQFTVRNDGPPIPPELLPTIFDPLVRGSSPSPKQRRPGSIGLGLYIAREVVVAHGGTIEVTSSIEAGTVFTVHLPRTGTGIDRPQRPPTPRPR